jgi:hypothetical protein
VGTPVWPETVAVFVEFCFADRFQNLLDTLLDQSVLNGGNPQRPHFAVVFFYLDPADRVGFEVCQPALDVCHQFLWLSVAQIYNSGVIYALCPAAFVPFDAAICKQDVLLACNQWKQVGKSVPILGFCEEFI